MRRIIRNAIQCKRSGDTIESVNVHDQEPVDMADKLAEYFHNSPELWMDLQKKFDEYKMKLQKG